MGLVINQHLINEETGKTLEKLCPFKAISYVDGKLDINAGCKLCKLCVNKGPKGCVTFEEDKKVLINKSLYKGIAVYCNIEDKIVHPITFELISKAKKLAAVNNEPVYVVMIGSDLDDKTTQILQYGIDKLIVYQHPLLKYFDVERYTQLFGQFINEYKPSVCLFGATKIGRSLAPRLAARFHTGLTADCTKLEMKENGDLVQIRPAFGGNIMAQIINPNNRPQFATVRYKIFDNDGMDTIKGEAVYPLVDEKMLKSNVEVIESVAKVKQLDISNSEVIVAVGRGLKSKDDIKMVEELCDLLGANLGCTRPLVENKMIDGKHQIGLSGKTVKPKLIITLGISGSVQFVAGMKSSDMIIAINNDKEAPIFDVANYGIVGDLYEIVPALIKMIKEG